MKNNQELNVGEIDEQVLVVRFQKSGDISILNLLLERWSAIAMGTAIQIMANKSDAEDMVQEAYLKIIHNINKFEGNYGVRAWVRKIVYNTCMNKKKEESKRKIREKKVSVKMEKISKEVSEDSNSSEIFELIKSKWDSLPQHYRLPVWMRHYESMEFKEIAISLSLSESTVKSQAKRGLDKLKGLLSKSGITLTTVLLANTFSYMESKATTEVIISQIPNILQGSNSASITHTAGSTLGYYLKTVLLICLLGVLSVFSYTKFLKDREVAMDSSESIVSKSFDTWTENFNDNKISNKIKVRSGKISLIKKGGWKNSSCLKIAKNTTVIKLKFPHAKLPVKISYKLSFIKNRKQADIVMWSSFDWACQVNGWGDMNNEFQLQKDSDTFWAENYVYLTERAIVSITDRFKTSLNIFDKGQRNEVIMIFYGSQLLDDLKIEEVDESEVPNYAIELKTVDAVSEKGKRGEEGILHTKLKGYKNKRIRFKFLKNEHVNGSDLSFNISGK